MAAGARSQVSGEPDLKTPEKEKPPSIGRLWDCLLVELCGVGLGHALEGLVVAAAVNRRAFRAHRAQVGGERPTVMNHVIVQEAEIGECRQVESTEEIDRR